MFTATGGNSVKSTSTVTVADDAIRPATPSVTVYVKLSIPSHCCWVKVRIVLASRQGLYLTTPTCPETNSIVAWPVSIG